MRLLCTLDNEQQGILLSQFLNEHHIANNYEAEINRDWGSDKYGTIIAKIWVIDEDAFESAEHLYEQFKINPPLPKLIPSIVEPIREYVSEEKEEIKQYISTKQSFITSYLLIFCCVLFFVGELTTPKHSSPLSSIPLTPLITSPVKALLLYDFPKNYELVKEFAARHGVDVLQTPQDLSRSAKNLLNTIQNTPYWQGLYDRILSRDNTPLINAPLFEKIRQGQFWRLFSPILLHGDLLHLLFNMLWLFVLGKQLEEKIGSFKYLLLILIAAAFTNTAQYMMTGPNFLGFSGVLCAMLTFIWMRQRKTPWEGYQLQQSTFSFILIFVFGMLGLQIISFGLELYTQHLTNISIANTAHISGLLIGLLLGKTNLFTRQS